MRLGIIAALFTGFALSASASNRTIRRQAQDAAVVVTRTPDCTTGSITTTRPSAATGPHGYRYYATRFSDAAKKTDCDPSNTNSAIPSTGRLTNFRERFSKFFFPQLNKDHPSSLLQATKTSPENSAGSSQASDSKLPQRSSEDEKTCLSKECGRHMSWEGCLNCINSHRYPPQQILTRYRIALCRATNSSGHNATCSSKNENQDKKAQQPLGVFFAILAIAGTGRRGRLPSWFNFF